MSNYHHGDLRNALIEAGLALLEEGGRAEISLRKAAARVGVSHAAPKNHFGDLRGLLTAIVAEGFRRHRQAMVTAMERAEDSDSARFQAVAEAYVTFARAQPALFRLMFSDEKLKMDDAALREASRGSYAVLEEVTARLTYSRSDSLPDGLSAQLLAWSLVHGFAHLALAGNFGPVAKRRGLKPELGDILPLFDFRTG